MAKDSRIEWTHHTFNPWWGCVKVSPACDHCYAEAWAKRVGSDVWGPETGRRFFGDAHWKEPLKWNRDAEAEGVRRRVFCASMADVFENRDDLIEPRKRLLDLIEATPMLDWLLLTKRIHLVKKLLPKGYKLPKHVWLGTTVENAEYAKKRLRYLLEFDTPSVRFVSCEPLLSELDLTAYLQPNAAGVRVDWVIAGGESGHGARPMNPAWPEALQKQCADAGVPFHFKQWGHWAPVDPLALPQGLPEKKVVRFYRGREAVPVVSVGKTAAGRILRGRTWDQFPATRGLTHTA
ncbi:protein gp37 [Pseudacidovorax intermedius]|uniref:Protein gp37 n=1 Tax=Pseudacidovorax intermedius TaxID=433924 RepID=A0A370FJ76_9BURK|nr:phage Gp37/Gp68 family protein [Pseudacidovorax intermedius]RDI25179.1 protein gp37 [Pseudacidovorax intermedius]